MDLQWENKKRRKKSWELKQTPFRIIGLIIAISDRPISIRERRQITHNQLGRRVGRDLKTFQSLILLRNDSSAIIFSFLFSFSHDYNKNSVRSVIKCRLALC